MSIQLVQQYRNKVDQIIRYSGTRNEQSLRKPFQDLLEQYARTRNLILVAEVEMRSKRGTSIRPDGVLKDALRQDWGFWESKDEKDDIEAEIKTKFARGYPDFNILFEDTHKAILYQGGERVMTADFNDVAALDALLTLFVKYEPAEVRSFREAIKLFSAEVGGLAETLRTVIDEQVAGNDAFKTALAEFLELCKKSINPKIEMADVREMIIQHVLTEDIFMRVFDEAEFHRDNIIAHKLSQVAGTFYTGDTKRNILARIKPYYETINARASAISDVHEKQKFLKALYESFYRAYNPKAADRLGIVYTPDEIVRFMIESADYLTYMHFGKGLGERGVEILDPATGTGTFITELIEYLPQEQLAYKYEHEMHCNEVAILPYYIANLNIEFTYKQKTGQYKEFENICFVDTLDNMGFEHTGKQMNFLGLTDENTERITRQNSKPIMVVIGNPPYNAWQENYNNQNANRAYPEIDHRIKDTYIKAGTAQNQIALYDMYTRFLRWASDRVGKDGMVTFISNNSFIDSRSYDGFRKLVAKEFNEIYIIDLKGNARSSGERRKREGGNIFNDNIKVGVAIYFMVRRQGQKGSKIFYKAIGDYVDSNEKRNFLRENKIQDLTFAPIHPDTNNNWLNLVSNDWNSLLPMADKMAKGKSTIKAIFSIYSNGVKTQRDEWVYDYSKQNLIDKMRFFIDIYRKALVTREISESLSIKWDEDLSNYMERGLEKSFIDGQIITSLYRPFVKSYLYFDKHFNGRTYQNYSIFPTTNNNIVIAVNGKNGVQWTAIVSKNIVDLNALYGGAQCFPLFSFNAEGRQLENITDWALGQFQKQYKDKKITKVDIFHYVYAVLINPAYRTKYEQNLKREFPRIPFYDDFWKWAAWGEKLIDLHLNYEQATPYPLERIDLDPEESRKALVPRLMARKDTGIIEVDTLTSLKGFPSEAWDYRLGTYSALEWVLERYKEKKPKDPTIAEKFNTYRFADYKEQVIDLLGKVCRVSVETMKIIGEMEG